MAPLYNSKKQPLYAWVPPNSYCSYKLTIEDNDGTVDDVSAYCQSIKVSDFVTESIGTFEILMLDPAGTFTNKLTGNETVRYYKDYASTATTLRFIGRIEKPSKQEYKLKLTGRSESLRFMDTTITKSYDGIECSVILKSIITQYLTWITTNNIEPSTTNLTVNWYQKPFWECVQELCNAAGFEAWLDTDLDFNFFRSGSRINTTDAIVHGYNMFEVQEFSPDVSLVKNRVLVYGVKQKGVQVMASAEDTTSQAKYGVRELIVNDDNITSYQQAKDRADYELSIQKDPPDTGSITGSLLASFKPGEMLRMSSPEHGLSPAHYFCPGYEDEIDLDGGLMKTTLHINKETRRISHVIKARIEQENSKKETDLNPYEMRDSMSFMFETEEGSHNGTEMANGILRVTTGESSGYWDSPSRTLSHDVTEAYLIMNGQFLNAVLAYVSCDDGITWQPITNRAKVTVLVTGKKLKLRLQLTDSNSQLESASLGYKVQP